MARKRVGRKANTKSVRRDLARLAIRNKNIDNEIMPGAVCSDCGKDVTVAEYESDTSKCCKKPVIDESEYK